MDSKTPDQHDSERFAALNSLKLMNETPEESFDELAQLVATTLDSDVVMISFIDKSKQLIKASVGTDMREIPLEESICSIVISERRELVVEDLAAIGISADLKESAATVLRSYAGIPIFAEKGIPVGVLCIAGYSVRRYSSAEIELLRKFGRQIDRLLELKTQFQLAKNQGVKLSLKRTALQNIAEGVLLQDHLGRIIDSNTAALNMFGLTTDRLHGRTSMDPRLKAIREDESPYPSEELPTALALVKGKAQASVTVGVSISDGPIRWLKVTSVPLFLDGIKPSHVVTSFADITDIRAAQIHRRTLEVRLTETAKLSALGEMAAGIAHEIKSPLAVIQGRADLLATLIEQPFTDSKPASAHLSKISEMANRIGKIINGLRSTSRNSESDPMETVSLTQILNDTLVISRDHFVQHRVPLNVVANENLLVSCRPSEISQIILNLLNNSLDAVHSLDQKWVTASISKFGHHAVIVIADSGGGIPKEVADRMMDAFYTTKKNGSGTGLGLRISQTIAKNHGGFLEYDHSQKNTTFILKLPLLEMN